jgi:hypothetical protein
MEKKSERTPERAVETEREAPPAEPPVRDRSMPETERHPVPGVKHEPEPDAENIMPAEDEPGTF